MTKEELIQELHESAEEIEELEGSYGYIFDDIADMVKDSDLVEVVRCKDCKYSQMKGETWGDCHNPRFGDGWANYPPPSVDEDGFCAWGEKRDEPVKHGKWIYGEDNLRTGADGWFCSKCRHFEAWDYSVDMKNAELNLPNVCPNCKAKMDEVNK